MYLLTFKHSSMSRLLTLYVLKGIRQLLPAVLLAVLGMHGAMAQVRVTSVSPNKAKPGTTITVSGANFSTNANRNKVWFGATRVQPTSSTSTSFTVTMPAGAVYGPITVTDTTTGLTGGSGWDSSNFSLPFLPTYDTAGFYTDSINIKSKIDFSVNAGASNPKGAAIGDVDGDGKPDMVTVNTDSSTATIFLNTSSGGTLSSSSFTSHRRISFSGRPNAIRLVDVDGDGRLDIVAALTNSTNINVCRNTSTTPGTATFATRTTIAAGFTTQVLTFADFNGDGKIDIAVTPNSISGSTTCAVLRNTSTVGTISFATATNITAGAGAVGIYAGDFDGDGKADLVTADANFSTGSFTYTGNTLSVLRNTSGGVTISFASAVTLSSGSGPLDVVGADIDNDGMQDILCTNLNDGTFSVFRNTSSIGSLSFASRVNFTTGTNPAGINVADLNGDERLDVVVSNNAGTSLSVFRNTTTSSTATFASEPSKTTGTGPTTVTLGDLDGDNYPDLVVGNQSSNTISIFENYPLPRIGAISGSTALCAGSTTTYTNPIGGGTWISSNTSVATISTGGVITGVAAGSATISYRIIIGGDTSLVTRGITIEAVNDAGTISGTSPICVGGTHTFTTSGSGGTWSSTNTSVATISTGGIVTGVSIGSATISYHVTTSASCPTSTATFALSVLAALDAGTISGTSAICAGGTTTFSTTGSGGSWSSTNTSVATVNSSTGDIYGVSAGSATISYTVTSSCGTVASSAGITINALPDAGTISGATSVCEAANTTLTTSGSGGVWSSSNTSVATVSTGGVVTGVAAGSATISYVVTTGSCGVSTATYGMTVNPLPSAGTVSGSSAICDGASTTFTTSGSGGTWSSSNTSIATVSTGGVVTGVSGGSATISYQVTNSCGTATATAGITIDPTPVAGTISGATSVCVSANTTLSSTGSGGTWSSSNTSVATISSAGVVTGVSSGSATITYTVTSGSCPAARATASMTVNPLPVSGTVSGASTVCEGAGAAFSTTGTGGTWSSSNTSVATVNTSGIVTGVASGSATISYTVTNSCGSESGTAAITVNPLPDPGTLSGSSTVCVGSSTTLSTTGSGGTWSSSNTSVATISTGGVVTGVATGSATISYSVTNSCGTVAATQAMTVNPLPSAGSLSGASSVCVAASTTLTPSVGGGTWSSSSSSTATVSTGGVVTGVAGGSATISYAVTNSCGTDYATHAITVNPLADAGTISGTSTVCIAGSTTYTTTGSAGTWSSSATGVATVSTGGVVTGVSAGSATITYNVISGCGTDVATRGITVSPATDAGTISGTASACISASSTLSASVGGGTWSSSNTSIATVNTSGSVYGVAAGSATISYSVTDACGTAAATQSFTVNPLPNAGTISGATSTCAGASTSLTSSGSIGTWSSSSTSVATVSTSGVVTGVAAGSATISYTVTNACGTDVATSSMTVNPLPDAGTLSGASTVCVAASTTWSSTASGGSWSSSNTSIATVSSGGVVTGVAAGSATITYSVTNSCGTDVVYSGITVNPLPSAGTISGASSVCIAANTTLTTSGSGGTWSSSATSVATVSTGGVVSGVSAGSATISYSVTNSCGTDVATSSMTVNALPDAGTISGTASACVGASSTLSTTASGGTWISSSSSVATVSTGGVVTGVTAGSATITYLVSSSCGTDIATQAFTVNPLPDAGSVSGSSTVCIAASTTLTSSGSSGGTWSSSATGTATVNSSTGVVHGVAVGSATISYSVTNSCGTDVATASISVNALPDAGTISGTTTVCESATTGLSTTGSGGIWTTSSASVATVNSSGTVTGVAAGSATISYSVSTSCGIDVATAGVTVNPLPVAGSISGTASACVGSSSSLSTSGSGGTWSSSSTSVASVSTSGSVYGVSAGSATISYSVSNSCGTDVATLSFTVNALPDAGTVSGSSPICEAATSTFSSTASGGVWSSSSASVATVSSGGVVTGVSSGTATISYSVSTVCGIAVATSGITVNPLPVAGTISGATSVCVAANTTLTTTGTGGTWSSSASGTATVSTGGVVTGVAAGSATISYSVTNSCGTDVATSAMTVNPLPDAGTLSGSTSLCPTTSSSFSSTMSGGTWSSSATSVATVSSGGVVTGVSAGSATIFYLVSNSCGSDNASAGVTVGSSPDAGTISGSTALCTGASDTFTTTGTGGSWSSSAPSVASVNSTTGVVTSVSAGSATISYSATTSCGTAHATRNVTVTATPSAGSISGTTTICETSSTTLTASGMSGGTWSSSAPFRATVSTTGNVTGVSAGTANISYSVTNSCGTDVASVSFTVNPSTSAGTISGASAVCIGASTTLTSSVSGGTWSSGSTSIATVNTSGDVYGVSAGSATISYSVTTSCGTEVVTASMTVNGAPSAGTLSGATSTCEATSTTLSSSVSGGTWSSSASSVATVDPSSGSVYGVSSGSATISYSVTDACGTGVATRGFTVSPAPVSGTLSGSTSVCLSSSTSFSSTASGGTWTSSSSSVASVSTSGSVYGVAAGSATISYSVTNSCGTATSTRGITVNPLPTAGTLSGATDICVASSTTFVSTASGGTWSSSATSVATVATSGEVYGVAAGSATISYTVTTSCGTDIATRGINVTGSPSAGTLSGSDSVCEASPTTLSSTVSGGLWSSASPGTATVNSTTGVVTGVAAGTATISYTVIETCGTDVVTRPIIVNPLPLAGTISGASAVCVASSVTLSSTVSGGTWSCGTTSIATVNSSTGEVTGVSGGSVDITYTYVNSCGTDVVTYPLTINPLPDAGTISGSTSVCVAATIGVSSTTSGGSWSTSDAAVASINASGVVFGVVAGSATLTYVVSNVCGLDTATYGMTVNPLPVAGTLSGTTSVCATFGTTLSSTESGGVWTSNNTAVASVNSTSGAVHGVSAGSATISYAVTNVCGTAIATTSYVVNPLPEAGTIGGSATVCSLATVTLTSSGTFGGSWSSSDPSTASVNASTGAVRGVTVGSTTITYIHTNGCGSDTATRSITVDPLPSAGSVSGAASTICLLSNTVVTASVSGGVWSSSSNIRATVDTAGVVTGRGEGPATISYSVTTGCGTAVATWPVTIEVTPDPGTISATTSLCVGASSTATATESGGTWTSSATSVATISTGGVITAVSAGSAFITYTVTNTCGSARVSRVLTVNGLPAVSTLTGDTVMIVGATPTFTASPGGGSWRSSATSVATISGSGVVRALAIGSAVISYTRTNICGSTVSTRAISVVAPRRAPEFLRGSSTLLELCSNYFTAYTIGSNFGVRDTSVGRTVRWRLVTPATRGTAVVSHTMTSTGGVLTPSSGSNITFAPDTNYVGMDSFVVGASNGYDSSTLLVRVHTRAVLVSVPTITGATEVCVAGTTTLVGSPSGGSFFRTGSGFNVTTGGVVTGTSAASSIVIYGLLGSNGCSAYAYAPMNVRTSPTSTTSGSTTVCQGASVTWTASRAGGTWSTAFPTTSTVSATGVVTGVGAGTDTLIYTTSNVCGTVRTRKTITVRALPNAGTISGAMSVAVGVNTTLTSSGSTGGVWSSSTLPVATVVSSTGRVRGVSTGTSTISYTVSNTCGTAVATRSITVTASKEDNNGVAIEAGNSILAYPNPTTGVITIELPQLNGRVEMIVVDAAGSVVNRVSSETVRTDIDMSYYASGIYFVRVVAGDEVYQVRVVKQ
jgi:uncharacterized protein YjdB